MERKSFQVIAFMGIPGMRQFIERQLIEPSVCRATC